MALTRKKLEDLWKTGKEYDLSPDNDGSAMVYIRKLGPTQQATAVRMANADRVRIKMLVDQPDDPKYLAIRDEIEELDREDKINQLALSEIAEERDKLEQELSEDPEWSEGEKLQSLVDSWENGLLQEYLKGEDRRSQESEEVFAEIKRFNDLIDSKLKGKIEEAERKYADMSDEAIDKKVIASRIDYEASLAWLRTFRMYQAMYGVQTLDRKPLFECIADVESLPAELFARVADALIDLTTPTLDVKS